MLNVKSRYLVSIEKTRKSVEINFGSVKTNLSKNRVVSFVPHMLTFFANLKLLRCQK